MLVETFTELMRSGDIVWLVAASIAGVILGAIPGLGGIVGLSILLPFVGDFGERTAFILITALTASVTTGDTIPAVLWGVPGTAGSQATVLDGHKMAKNGEAVRALSASYAASVTGGLFGAAVLMLLLPFAASMILSVQSPEMLMFAVAGLAMIGVLGGRAPLAGLLTGILGLVIAMVGQDRQSGIYRWTFGEPYLLTGIDIVPVALGLFAVPEVLELFVKGQFLSDGARLRSSFRDVIQGISDVARDWFLVIRNSVLGVAVGAVPGVGASVVDWIAYGHTVQSTKDKSRFGFGDVRGVIGPESANNAKVGGSLIPTLVFGVPGGLSMVFVLAAMIRFGLNPGPRFVAERPDLISVLIVTIVLSNIFAAAFCMGLLPFIGRIVTVPVRYLVPAITAAVVVAALQVTWHVGDLIVLAVFGLLGWVLVKAQWPRPPLILAVVLGPIIQQRLQISNRAYGMTWLFRPGVIIMIALMIAVVAFGIVGRRRNRKRSIDAHAVSNARHASPVSVSARSQEPLADRPRPGTANNGDTSPSEPLRRYLAASLLAMFVAVIVSSLQWPPSPRMFALFSAVPGAILALVLMWGSRDATANRVGGARRWEQKELEYIAIFVAACLASWALGVRLGLSAFMTVCLMRFREKPVVATGIGAATFIVLHYAAYFFSFPLPEPWLWTLMGQR